MEIYWLEQNQQDVPSTNDWLSPNEFLCLATLTVPKRRNEWRLGRWTAKQAVAAHCQLPTDAPALAMIEILPEASGAPQAFISDQAAQLAISISHSHGIALCAASVPCIRMGCDVEWIEPRSPAFLQDYFTAEEQALVGESPEPDRDLMATLLWSAKESALKAMKQGLRLDTRTVMVRPGNASVSAGWSSLEVRSVQVEFFSGWSSVADGFVRTIVTDVPCCEPLSLQPGHSAATGSHLPSQYCTNFYGKGVPLVTSARDH